jgi:hypothetical protein
MKGGSAKIAKARVASASLIVSAIAFLCLPGCASKDERMSLTMEERLQASMPEAPPILSIPVLTLFTNQPGFGAHCRVQRGGASEHADKSLNGELLHRGSQFLFAAEAQEKHARGREMTFMWDMASNSGHVLNDALPGYAPVPARAQLTGFQSTGKAPSEEKINGHSCTQEQVTVSLSDGTQSQLTVWHATDFHGLPVRIRAESGQRFVINLNDVRLQEPSAALFEIPRDFTKYDSPKAMFDELFRRESLTRRTNKGQPAFDEDAFQKTGPNRQY